MTISILPVLCKWHLHKANAGNNNTIYWLSIAKKNKLLLLNILAVRTIKKTRQCSPPKWFQQLQVPCYCAPDLYNEKGLLATQQLLIQHKSKMFIVTFLIVTSKRLGQEAFFSSIELIFPWLLIKQMFFFWGGGCQGGKGSSDQLPWL